MQIILDHLYQLLPGDVLFTVSLPPAFIQITKPGTLQLTNLTVPRLDLIMNVTNVVPQSLHVVELQFTLITLLTLLSPGVVSPDVFQQIFVGGEGLATLLTGELLVGMMSLNVVDQISFVLQYLAAVNTEMLPEGVLVEIPLVLG